MDKEGAWGWQHISVQRLFHVQEKLMGYERKTWDEAYNNRGSGLKHIPIDNLPGKARKRLEKLKLDDVDGLWEFRLSGLERVWGVRMGNVCYLLWWDPDHKVFPSTKRNT